MNFGCMYTFQPKTVTWKRNLYMKNIINLMIFYMKKGIQTKTVNIVTDTNVSISGTVFSPKTNFSIALKCTTCADVRFKIENTFLENTLLQINNTMQDPLLKPNILFSPSACVCHSVHGGCLADTPLGKHPPPPWADIPLGR